MLEKKLEFRKKFDYYHKICKHPELIRDGSIREFSRELALRDKVPEKEYWGYFLDFANALVGDHPYFKKSRNTIDAEAIISTLKIGRRVLKEAVKHHLNEQVGKTFSEDRVERMQAMVNYLYKSKLKIRKDALEGFRNKWNTGRTKTKHVSYDALKKDLIALSYAFLPVRKKETEPEHVIKSHRKDFEKARVLKHQGLLDHNKTVQVCKAFTEHSIDSDLERIKRETIRAMEMKLSKSDTERLTGYKERFAEVLNEIYELRKSEPNVHSVTASNSVWQKIGWPLHAVIPRVNDLVYSMYDLAEEKQRNNPIRLEDFALPFDATKPDVLEHMRKTYGIVPRGDEEEIDEYELRKQKKAIEEITGAWDVHLAHAIAQLDYEKARHALKGKKEYHKEIGWKHPTEFKSVDRETKRMLKQAMEGKEAEAGRYLDSADDSWHLYKKMLENSAFLQ